MHYIHILNDFQIGKKKMSAEQILDILLKRKCWVYNSNTPNFSKFSNGDKIIIYMAGVGRRSFVACFEFAGGVEKHKLDPVSKEEKVLFNMFSFMAPIKNIIRFQDQVSMAEIKIELDFISDKKNYGLYLRQATKKISESDYNKIFEASKSKQLIK